MTNPLTGLLAKKGYLLADGATGTNLFNMGLESGEPPEFWNTDKPQNILTLYRGAVNAGSDLFLTNSFGGNASRLKLHGAQGRVHELNKAAAELGRDVADASGVQAFDDVAANEASGSVETSTACNCASVRTNVCESAASVPGTAAAFSVNDAGSVPRRITPSTCSMR